MLLHKCEHICLPSVSDITLNKIYKPQCIFFLMTNYKQKFMNTVVVTLTSFKINHINYNFKNKISLFRKTDRNYLFVTLQ